MIEAVIHHTLKSHCIEDQIISQKQAAYVCGDYTINQLLCMVHRKKGWTNKNITHEIFSDLDSVFDETWHKGMLSKLQSIGIVGEKLDLFTSYLNDKKKTDSRSRRSQK